MLYACSSDAHACLPVPPRCSRQRSPQGTSVENWVQYGLGLPQYRDSFIQNAVTVLDFPLFLEQQQLLEQELKITSVLHQRQILRAMHAIILGIGNAPLAVKNVRHESSSDGAMLVAWDLPESVRVASSELIPCLQHPPHPTCDAHMHLVQTV